MAVHQGNPTYEELISLLDFAENQATHSKGGTVANILAEQFKFRFPHIPISRPGRFLDTVRRLAAPTKSSTIGKTPLNGSPLRSYLQRQWIPRIRGAIQAELFPSCGELQRYGVTESLLQESFIQCDKGETYLSLTLDKPVTLGFYRELHKYLKKWPVSRSASKTAIGRFYYSNFQLRIISKRPDNIYLFVEKLTQLKKPDTDSMTYSGSVSDTVTEQVITLYSNNLTKMAQTVSSQQNDLDDLQIQLEEAKQALADVNKKLKVAINQKESANRRLQKCQQTLEATVLDAMHYEAELLAKNEELTEMVQSVKKEISSFSEASSFCQLFHTSNGFCFKTKDGGSVYSAKVRTLYYTLLAQQLPPAKIAPIIKSILKSFLPSLDVDSLELPAESCASYMRRHELTTINLAHNATSLLERAEKFGGLSLNSDGTTLAQKKLQGAVLGGMVLSVNEVPDGSADSMITDISGELHKLREIAEKLQLPNANKINWTLIKSSTSDSAATQKRFNKLIEEKRIEDEERYGSLSSSAEFPDVIELVENLCCMHLGVNLRKAFFEGIKEVSSSVEDNPVSDILVHEFCKLLGQHGTKHGVPEYAHGSVAFPDFLELMCSSSDDETRLYYTNCLKIKLDRQVGSRYFVTAFNAGKIVFLCKAAIEFLKYIGKDKGNRLEQSVFKKLHDSFLLSHLKADAVMFHHVYCNLVMLAKSTALNKSVFEMNTHYCELLSFLSTIEDQPELALNKSFEVFVSERRLYGTNKALNHRLHPLYADVEEKIFEDGVGDSVLLELLGTGAASMKKKLLAYAKSQLPGGKYWDPEEEVALILQSLKPNNDICESILGLNDYLSTALPNMHQVTQSNLVQAKKNKTMNWLGSLPVKQQADIVDMARESRKKVAERCKEVQLEHRKKRQEKMQKEKLQRDALARRAEIEKERLSKLHLIHSVDELQSVLDGIENESISMTKKTKKKLSLLREQINIRKKVLQEKINIPFTSRGKQRLLSDIIQEFSAHLQSAACTVESSSTAGTKHTSEALVGKCILHRFEVDGKEEWFEGHVIGYNVRTNEHEILYDAESDESYFFNLLEDVSRGDLIVKNT